MSEDTIVFNDQMILIGGVSGAGKSAALRNIRNKNRWIYLNAEAGKRLPFKNDFINVRITDPYQVFGYIDDAIAAPEHVDGLIIDSSTFLMDMFESQYVLGQADTMKGWSNYAQFWKELMQVKLVEFGKPVIIIAHVLDVLDEKAMEMKRAVPIKGALKNQGVEAYFSTVVEATTIPVKDLGKYDPALLNVSEDETEIGFKYVFQTRKTAKTVGTRIRSPMGMFNAKQTYIDNDAQLLLDHLHKFYDT
ncbi:AAA family ATPase [Aquabacterium sp.]|uniref:AAA family ATPase n=1 Tax=Aquabacterium sp. TaxID=1872578 RepID=UPI0025B97D9F|nr:AAA family ATPase [Aquabacterium sp.]